MMLHVFVAVMLTGQQAEAQQVLVHVIAVMQKFAALEALAKAVLEW